MRNKERTGQRGHEVSYRLSETERQEKMGWLPSCPNILCQPTSSTDDSETVTSEEKRKKEIERQEKKINRR